MYVWVRIIENLVKFRIKSFRITWFFVNLNFFLHKLERNIESSLIEYMPLNNHTIHDYILYRCLSFVLHLLIDNEFRILSNILMKIQITI